MLIGPYTRKLIRYNGEELYSRLNAGNWVSAADCLPDVMGFFTAPTSECHDPALAAWWRNEGEGYARERILHLSALSALSQRLFDWHNNDAVYVLACTLQRMALDGAEKPTDFEDQVRSAVAVLERGSTEERAMHAETVSTLQDEELLPRPWRR